MKTILIIMAVLSASGIALVSTDLRLNMDSVHYLLRQVALCVVTALFFLSIVGLLAYI